MTNPDGESASAQVEWIGPGEVQKLLGMSRSSFYRFINKMKHDKTLSAGTAEVVPELGGIRWPNGTWRFRKDEVVEFRDQMMEIG